ncbi:MAG: hypothetical protein HFI09_05135 [Bacilli bacterium]|nr:hypothetical protein [Bacilli bacterium]
MSFAAARLLVERNRKAKKIESDSQIIPDKNLLLEQYKRQVERYQEISKEIANLQNCFQREKDANNDKKLTSSVSEIKEKQRNEPLTLNIFLNLQDLQKYLHSAPDLDLAKKHLITLLYEEATSYNQIALEGNLLEQAECKKEIKEILSKIQWIKNYQKPEQTKEQTINHNNLIYLTSSSGRIIPLEEITKDIPIEFYDLLKETLLSIKNGTFLGFKSLSYKKYNELRKIKVRVLFKQINENTFLILSCFIKNYTSQKKYSEDLKRLNKILEEQESNYTTLARNPYYLEEQAKITETIMELLTTKRGKRHGRTLERIDN